MRLSSLNRSSSHHNETPLALYVHWPYCLSKCPYCDFNSHVADHVDHQRWSENLVRDLAHQLDQTGRKGDPLKSLFFGGGTPSLMAPETMANIINTAKELLLCDDDLEITMEANPTSVEAEKLQAFKEAGANRLSMGIQSLRKTGLHDLGREHSASEALSALEKARLIFPRVSADFIYARSGQTIHDWQIELEEILALGLDHLSLYQLTIEMGTAFYSRHQRGLLEIPDADTARQFFDLTQDMTYAANCPAYEISNHAKPGQESQHNMIYWQAFDWIGVGPGAYGRFWQDGKRLETRSRRDPAAWLDDVETNGHGIDQTTEDNLNDFAHEALMMGLRLKKGVDLERIISISGEIDQWACAKTLEQMINADFLILEHGYLRLTDQGRPLLNMILNKLIQA